MDNQHRKIMGYRDLTQEEIHKMNDVKQLGEEIRRLIDRLETVPDIDKRWLSIGVTDLQKGFMAVVRSIAKPKSF